MREKLQHGGPEKNSTLISIALLSDRNGFGCLEIFRIGARGTGVIGVHCPMAVGAHCRLPVPVQLRVILPATYHRWAGKDAATVGCANHSAEHNQDPSNCHPPSAL
jgi:hypothetical protein